MNTENMHDLDGSLAELVVQGVERLKELKIDPVNTIFLFDSTEEEMLICYPGNTKADVKLIDRLPY